MNEKFMVLLTIVPVIFITFVVQILTPKFTRKEIYFGVRLTEKQLQKEEIKKIYKVYIKNNIMVSLVYIIILCLIVLYLNNFAHIVEFMGILCYLGITFLIYYSANNKVKILKKRFSVDITQKSAVVIDTKFTKDKRKNMLASPWWFLIPIIIILVNMVIAANVYDKLPDKLPIHWNAVGQINGWVKKSYVGIFQMPFIQLFMTAVMFFSYKIIGWSKQQISSSNPESSAEQNRIFRYRWSIYMILMNIVMVSMFTYTNFNTLQIIKSNSKAMMVATLGMMIFISVLTIITILKTGQGGSRIKFKNKSKDLSNLIDRDDDKYWKVASSIYVNKDDPAIFIEKRFGIGWTMNFGRIESFIIVVVFFALIVLIRLIFKTLG